ncbi:MAG: cation-transporting P-type ATPase [Clostridia bacterium]|nr:cation-transporting P-type ATPase [Clostridia bacterium]
MKKIYEMTKEEVFESVRSSEKGLKTEQAEERLQAYGENVLKEKNKKSPIKIFFSQFSNMMVLLLILVGVVSLVYSIVNSESVIESVVIFSCLLINVIMGFVQEMKSENAIDALKTMTQSKVQVKRDGVWVEIDTAKLVVGDVIQLDAGDKVPADARIIKAVNAKVDESILTGESLQVDKDDEILSGDKLIQDQINIVFSGTSVTNGKIEAVVIKTGMETELGKIAGSLDSGKEALTPLQVKIKKVSGFITVIACILIAATLCYGLILEKDALSIIVLCISMVLAAVPEVLPVSITATLTIGVQQMSKRKTIVKQLAAIETLGATQIVCSDKTGTITTNQMTLVELYANEKTYLDIKKSNQSLEMIQNIMGLCNDNEVNVENKGDFIGDPVEVALSKYLYNINLSLDYFRNEHERVNEIPFDSGRKMMSTVNKFDNKLMMMTKGGLGAVLPRCVGYYKNGKVVKMTKLIASKFLAKEKSMSKKAYKVLAFAYRTVDLKEEYTTEDENGLILVGLCGLVDPPKDGVKEAVKKCKEAKMRPIMITGDSLATAMAVAIEVGIAKDDGDGVEGKAIDGLTDDELVSFVKKYTVYARVTPEHKVRIVRAFQSAGKVVAMTGDGVNDAPALKLAHVGIGMGKAGTDVTKNVADIILMDDSFATIVTAVEEGRRIYSNVLRTILYNLSSNFAEIFLIIIGMIMMRDIISPLHILYIDIVADTIPSIALAFEKNDKKAMKHKPNGINKRVFTPFMIAMIVGSAIIESAISLVIFFVADAWYGHKVAMTLALLSVVLTELTFTYNCKELKDFSFKKGLFGNKVMNISTLAIFAIQIPVFFTGVGSLFGLTSISILQFVTVVGITIIGFFVVECVKPILAKLFKDK